MDTSFLAVLPAYDQLTLEEATQAISQHPKVIGVLVVGSTADTTRFKPYSDYDILVVWEETRPIHVVLTYINHKLTDLVFTDKPTLEKITQEQVYTHTTEASLCHWLRSGKIVHDREGFLATLQAKLLEKTVSLPASKDYVFGVWYGVLYNYHQNWRMWESGDELYHQALHLRLLYGVWGIVVAYFLIRELPWQGEKDAIRYWQAHDPQFHSLIQQSITAPTLAEKMTAYRQVAELALASVGGLVTDNLTIIEPVDLTQIDTSFMQGLGAIVQQLLEQT